MGVLERIKEIEAEMARTQKNKATNVSLPNLLQPCESSLRTQRPRPLSFASIILEP
jgi:ribosome-interacting GTPase 1